MSQSDALREALRHSPDNLPLLLLCAQALLNEGAPGEARALFEKVLTLDAGHREGALGLARVLLEEGKTSAAAVRLEELLRRDPACAPAHLLLARVLLREGSKSDAAEHYRRAVELDRGCLDAALARELGTDLQGGAEERPRSAMAATSRGAALPKPLDEGEEWKAADEADLPAPLERPTINFAQVGGMDALKEQIRMKILYPMQNPDLFRAYGKNIGGGVLLYGPPGCGKTLISRATAGEIKASFFCIGLHDVLDMWLGNSEKNLHQLFRTAREHAPSVLFFDEVDALAADRRDLRQSAGRTVINQFLAEMDGGTAVNDGVLILGATNAPWHIDPAFRRPGRFDRTVFVPPPDEVARTAIIELMAREKPFGSLDARAVAKKTDGFSGADLKAVFDRATEEALTSAMQQGKIVPLETKALLRAAAELKPSTKAWFESAKNYALYANQGGFYDEILAHLGIKR